MKNELVYEPDPMVLRRGSHPVVDSYKLKQIRDRVRINYKKNRKIQIEPRFMNFKTNNMTKIDYENDNHFKHEIKDNERKRMKKKKQNFDTISEYEIPYNDELIMSDSEANLQEAEENDAPNMMTLTDEAYFDSPRRKVTSENKSNASYKVNGNKIMLSPIEEEPFDEIDAYEFNPNKNRKEEKYSQTSARIQAKNNNIKSKELPSVIDFKYHPHSRPHPHPNLYLNGHENLRRYTEPALKPKLFVPRKNKSPLRNQTNSSPPTFNPNKFETALNVKEFRNNRNNTNQSNKKKLKKLKPLKKDTRPTSIAAIRKKYASESEGHSMYPTVHNNYSKHTENQPIKLPKTAPNKQRKIKTKENVDVGGHILLQRLQEQERQYQINLHRAIADTKIETETRFQEMIDSFNHEKETLSYIKQQLEQREIERERLKKELEYIRHYQEDPFFPDELEKIEPTNTGSLSPQKSAQENILNTNQSSPIQSNSTQSIKIYNILLIDLIHVPFEMENYIISILRYYHQLCKKSIESNRGEQITSIGNTIMSIFQEENVQECIECAIDLLINVTNDLNYHIGNSLDENGVSIQMNTSTHSEKEKFENRIHIGVAIARGNLQHLRNRSYAGKVLQKIHTIGIQLPAVKHKLAMDEEFTKHLRQLDKYKQKCVNIGSIQLSAHQERLYSLMENPLKLSFIADEEFSESESVYRSLSPLQSKKNSKKLLGFGTIGRIFKLGSRTSSPKQNSSRSVTPNSQNGSESSNSPPSSISRLSPDILKNNDPIEFSP